MRNRLITAGAALLLLLCFLPIEVHSEGNELSAEQNSYVSEEILVIYESTSQEECEVITIPEGMSAEEVMEVYESEPDVAFVQPNYYYELCDANSNVAAGNDPFTETQWYLDAIEAKEAWKSAEQNQVRKVKVAVIDSGVDLSHEDLAQNLLPGLSRNEVNNEILSGEFSADSHGTAVNGIIGAVTGNGIGISGIAGDCVELINICVYDTSSRPMRISTKNLVSALQYAAELHVDIINMSLGSYQYDEYLEQILSQIKEQGITVICAGGNGGTDNPHYPSDFDSTIGVIALDEDLGKSSFSNYGAKKTISAPGSSLYTTVAGNRYTSKSGSSMASPVVTAVAAMMLSVNPTLQPDQLKTMLAETATDLNAAGFDSETAYGLVNAKAAVEKAALQYRDNRSDNHLRQWIENCYLACGNELIDEERITYWYQRAKSESFGGDKLGSLIIAETDYHDSVNTDAEYIDFLYACLLGREADCGGKAFWLEQLSGGTHRVLIKQAFLTSEEFENRCIWAGINSSSRTNDEAKRYLELLIRYSYRSAYIGNTCFDDRYYEGLADNAINHPESAAENTRAFLNTINHENMTDEEKVKCLYHVILGRNEDPDGYRYWLGRIRDNRNPNREPHAVYGQEKPLTFEEAAEYFLYSKEYRLQMRL